MAYFSRLTDIVTCNLTSLLEQADDPHAALDEIIHEMREGVAGANRSVKTATANEQRIRDEIAEHRGQVDSWRTQARTALEENRESAARQALLRKREVEDLIAGLEQQLDAASSTREHLTTILHALQARLADALRRHETGNYATGAETAEDKLPQDPDLTRESDDIDSELDALRREVLGG